MTHGELSLISIKQFFIPVFVAAKKIRRYLLATAEFFM
jgi:hypothetical protein